MVSEKACVLTYLDTAFDFGLCQIGNQEGVKLPPIAANDARAIAEQLIWTRRREKEDLSSREPVLVTVVQTQNEIGDVTAHDGIGSVGCKESLGVDATKPENHGRVLHLAVLAQEGWKSRHGGNVGVAAR